MGKTFAQHAETASFFLAPTSSGADERPIDVRGLRVMADKGSAFFWFKV